MHKCKSVFTDALIVSIFLIFDDMQTQVCHRSLNLSLERLKNVLAAANGKPNDALWDSGSVRSSALEVFRD